MSVSQDEISQGVQILEDSKNQGPEADGNYADPTIYKNMYDAWVNGGGKGQDFLKQYPIKQYINPANNWLPTYLRPATPKKTTTNTPPWVTAA